jgi:hypothetical protein
MPHRGKSSSGRIGSAPGRILEVGVHVPESAPAASRFPVAFLVLLIPVLLGASALRGQSAPLPAPTERFTQPGQQVGRLVCPGSFPTDLTVTNCEYTAGLRVHQWITTSFTDESMLGAIVYGTGAEIIRSPSEWARTWQGLGQRIGVRYTQAAARGSAEYIMGNILQDDPRHLSYKNDPHTHYGMKVVSCNAEGIETKWYGAPAHLVLLRIGHPFLDAATVLHSSPCGNGRRLPALDRLVGVWAGAYAGNPWYPQSQNTLSNVGQRAGMAYASTLLGSFYTEFSPEITRGITRLFSSSRKPQ